MTVALLVAGNVVGTKQIIKGEVVRVELFVTENNVIEETSQEHENSEQESATVLVSNLPKGATENGIYIHFQKKKNGGGEVVKVIFSPEKDEAMVIFEDIEGM